MKIALRTVDAACGGRRGFAQAIEDCLKVIGNQKLLQEKAVLESFFEQVSRDTGYHCFSLQDTMQALAMGAVETLIVSEDLDVQRLASV